MFNSFAQLASSLEASLSLDALQTSTTETKKVEEETTSAVSKGIRNDRNEIHPNNKKGERSSEDTEMQLVEEVSRISELLRLKDEEGISVNMKLSEALDELQSGKLAYSDIKNELKEAKSTMKSMAQASDDKMNSSAREISDLTDECSKLKKCVAEKENLINSLQTKPIVKPQADIVDGGEIQHTEDNLQLQDEIASLNMELAQNLAMLKSAKEQIISFENLLDEAKAFRRQNEDQLVANQREISTLKEELCNIQSEKEKEKELYGSKLESAETNSVEQKKQFESQIEALKAKITVLESHISQQESSYEALKGASERQSSTDAEKSSEMEDLYRSLSEASESIEHEKSLTTIANAELAELRCSLTESERQLSELRGKNEERDKRILDLEGAINEKNNSIADLQAKQSTLTEKTKDIVKKYSEMKTKNQNLEQSGGEKSAEATKSLQNKESEVLSLRLKLENTERGLGDQRAMAAELADRYGDTQRELARVKAAVQDHILTVESQLRDLEKKDFMISQLNTEKAVMERAVDSAQNAQTELERQILELKDEKTVIQEQLRSGGDSARVLDEYKKRAQTALKKSNSASAVITAELAVVQRSLVDAQLRLTETEEALADITLKCENLEIDLSRTKGLLEVAEMERDGAIASEKAASAAAAQAAANLKEISALQASATAALQGNTSSSSSSSSEIKIHSSEVDNKRNSSNSAMKDFMTKSAEGSDDDIVLVSNPELDPWSAGGKDLMPDSSSSVGIGLEMKRTGASASSGRRILIEPEDSVASSDGTSFSEPPVDDIDSVRSTSNVKQKNASSDQLYYVNELYSQIDELKREAQQKGAEAEATRQELQNELTLKKALEGRVEELLAYLDRSKKFQGDGPDTATNTEYLKNCVYRFMATTEHSERKRLAPVIGTILKLTTQEKRHIDYALAQGDGDDNIATLASFGAFAGSFFGATPHANTSHSS